MILHSCDCHPSEATNLTLLLVSTLSHLYRNILLVYIVYIVHYHSMYNYIINKNSLRPELSLPLPNLPTHPSTSLLLLLEAFYLLDRRAPTELRSSAVSLISPQSYKTMHLHISLSLSRALSLSLSGVWRSRM